MRDKSKINKMTLMDKQLLLANPLAGKDFEIVVRKMVRDGVFKKDKDNDLIPLEQDLESDSCVKIYTKSDYRILTANLHSPAQRLYLHILYELPYGVDYIEINWKRYMKENNLTSINTYKGALKELCRYLFIYPSLIKGVYWINPSLFFCGNRVAKYPNNIIIK